MALSDLAVFNEYAYTTMTEVLSQNVELFNAATQGGIVLQQAANQGDYNESASWQLIGGLVRRRNAYGSGAVSAVDLKHIMDRSVKVAAGTPPVNMPPGQFTWIQRSPEEAGVVIGEQLAKASLQDMVGVALTASVAALTANSTTVYDGTAGVASLSTFVEAASKFGDRAQDIACWVMHSKSQFDIYRGSLANAASLFSFGSINVRDDGFGRRFVVADQAGLSYVATGTKYRIVGFVPGGVVVEQNNDFDQNIQTTNGDENIQRTYQAEWTFNAGVKGFAWDKTNGGHSPSNSALATGTNWDKYVTSDKDIAGVMANVQ